MGRRKKRGKKKRGEGNDLELMLIDNCIFPSGRSRESQGGEGEKGEREGASASRRRIWMRP